ncbi:MAG: cob(I)yrinic acid a,c-diamide adenosyltransferase [Acidobacteriota bacterium]|nr:cob(I)yrinic acid a,c-diamide adenosyltransferase [Acidobacteriota bacterium]
MSETTNATAPDSRRGLILINTGPGKGKTTAALGTAFRAAGNGMRVLFLQFLKGSWHYGELDAAEALNRALATNPGAPSLPVSSVRVGEAPPSPEATPQNFIIKQLGRGFVKVGGAETDPEDIRLVEAAWAESAAAILSGEWDLVVLDEINYAIGYKMLDPEAVAEVLRRKPEMTHVILTGRNAHPILVELADTVTEMREVKHAYQKGILAQRGIEF